MATCHILMYNNPLLKNYFKLYCRFFNIDMEIAILEGSAFDTIELFKNNLSLLLNKKVTPIKVKESLKILEKSISKHSDLYSKIRIYDEHVIVNLEIKSIFEGSVTYFNQFIEAFEFVEDTLGLDSKDIIMQDLLSEFNHAMGHLLSSFFQHDHKIQHSNITKTNLHLSKGILDAYKEVIHKNHEMIRTDSAEIELLDKKTYLQFYIGLRIVEASTFGHTAASKDKVIMNYKKLAWSLIS